MKNDTLNQQLNILISPTVKRIQPFFAFLILPFINGIVLFLADPIRENISYIAYTLGYRMIGILWVCSCAFYLYVYTMRFAYTLHYRHCIGKWMLALSTIGMVLSVLIPYMPDTFPLLARIHIQMSIIATMSYVLVVFHILIISYFREPIIISSLLPYYITIIGGCLLLFLLMGCVSTILEVSFVITMGLFLWASNKKIETL